MPNVMSWLKVLDLLVPRFGVVLAVAILLAVGAAAAWLLTKPFLMTLSWLESRKSTRSVKLSDAPAAGPHHAPEIWIPGDAPKSAQATAAAAPDRRAELKVACQELRVLVMERMAILCVRADRQLAIAGDLDPCALEKVVNAWGTLERIASTPLVQGEHSDMRDETMGLEGPMQEAAREIVAAMKDLDPQDVADRLRAEPAAAVTAGWARKARLELRFKNN
jgi:hypothetical protein